MSDIIHKGVQVWRVGYSEMSQKGYRNSGSLVVVAATLLGAVNAALRQHPAAVLHSVNKSSDVAQIIVVPETITGAKPGEEKT